MYYCLTHPVSNTRDLSSSSSPFPFLSLYILASGIGILYRVASPISSKRLQRYRKSRANKAKQLTSIKSNLSTDRWQYGMFNTFFTQLLSLLFHLPVRFSLDHDSSSLSHLLSWNNIVSYNFLISLYNHHLICDWLYHLWKGVSRVRPLRSLSTVHHRHSLFLSVKIATSLPFN